MRDRATRLEVVVCQKRERFYERTTNKNCGETTHFGIPEKELFNGYYINCAVKWKGKTFMTF